MLTPEADHLFKAKLNTSACLKKILELNRTTSHPMEREDTRVATFQTVFHSARASPTVSLLPTNACPSQAGA